ncbi:hypothetical protein Tco_1214518 [Tanacetum coccineum]
MTTSKLSSLIGIRSISKGGIFSIEARDMDTKLLSAPESNNTLARCWFRRNIPVTTFRSCSCWNDSIKPEGFLSFVLLWLVIIIAVVGVGVTSALWALLIGFTPEFEDRASSVKVPVANFTLQSSVQLLWENTNSVSSNQWISPTAPSVPLKLIGWQLMNSLKLHFLAT